MQKPTGRYLKFAWKCGRAQASVTVDSMKLLAGTLLKNISPCLAVDRTMRSWNECTHSYPNFCFNLGTNPSCKRYWNTSKQAPWSFGSLYKSYLLRAAYNSIKTLEVFLLPVHSSFLQRVFLFIFSTKSPICDVMATWYFCGSCISLTAPSLAVTWSSFSLQTKQNMYSEFILSHICTCTRMSWKQQQHALIFLDGTELMLGFMLVH